MDWAVTVAAIVERQGRFLMVEETDGVNPERVLNQPAGHVEPGESLAAAIVREMQEETGLPFEVESFVGIYQLKARNGHDYLRICFAGSVPEHAIAQPADAEILACHWLTPEEIAVARPRSSVVLRCLQDYRSGRRLPLAAALNFHQDR